MGNGYRDDRERILARLIYQKNILIINMDNKEQKTDEKTSKNNYVKRLDYYKKYYISKKKKIKKVEFNHNPITITFD